MSFGTGFLKYTFSGDMQKSPTMHRKVDIRYC